MWLKQIMMCQFLAKISSKTKTHQPIQILNYMKKLGVTHIAALADNTTNIPNTATPNTPNQSTIPQQTQQTQQTSQSQQTTQKATNKCKIDSEIDASETKKKK